MRWGDSRRRGCRSAGKRPACQFTARYTSTHRVGVVCDGVFGVHTGMVICISNVGAYIELLAWGVLILWHDACVVLAGGCASGPALRVHINWLGFSAAQTSGGPVRVSLLPAQLD